MRVKLKKGIKSIRSNLQRIEYDKEYEVIIVSLTYTADIYIPRVSIVDESKVLTIYDINDFEVIDAHLSDDFIIRNYGISIELAPKAISYDSFLEDYHNDDERARNAFKSAFPHIKIWNE